MATPKKKPLIFSYEWAVAQVEKSEGNGDQPFFSYIGMFLILFVVGLIFDKPVVNSTFFVLGALAPIWLPILLFKVVYISFVNYKRFITWFSIDRILLEIQLPPNVDKSPEAMEIVLSSLWNVGGETTWIDRIFLGKFRAVWSLEIASNEGRISFYMSMPRSWKNIISSRIYGQFPEARVEEVEDYVTKVPFSFSEYELFAMEYEKSVPQALPIKGYKQYGLDRNTDSPETSIDPITHLLELFSSIGKDEYLWFQIILKARKGDEWYGTYLKGDIYKDTAQAEIKKMYSETQVRAQGVGKDLKLEHTPLAMVTEGEKRRVDNIEMALTKLTFDCGVRSMYLAKKDVFNGVNIGSLVNLFVPLRGNSSGGEYNTLGIANRGLIRYQYPWQDFKGMSQSRDKKNLWFWYANRAYFYVPLNQEPTYLNTEELATLWHFPNAGVVTPGLQRVPSRTGEAPLNLPI